MQGVSEMFACRTEMMAYIGPEDDGHGHSNWFKVFDEKYLKPFPVQLSCLTLQ